MQGTGVAALIVAALSLGAVACSSDDVRRGDGVRLEREHRMPAFQRLRAEGPIQVALRPVEEGDEAAPVRLSIAGDRNLVDLIDLTMRDERLELRPLEALEPDLFLVVEAQVPPQRAIELRGAAIAHLNDFHAPELYMRTEDASAFQIDSVRFDRFQLDHGGEARGRLHGKVGELVVNASGDSHLELDQATVRVARINASGNAYVRVCARDLHVTVRDEATVLYTCRPRGDFVHRVLDEGVLQYDPVE